jgi:hypothetical protein
LRGFKYTRAPSREIRHRCTRWVIKRGEARHAPKSFVKTGCIFNMVSQVIHRFRNLGIFRRHRSAKLSLEARRPGPGREGRGGRTQGIRRSHPPHNTLHLAGHRTSKTERLQSAATGGQGWSITVLCALFTRPGALCTHLTLLSLKPSAYIGPPSLAEGEIETLRMAPPATTNGANCLPVLRELFAWACI